MKLSVNNHIKNFISYLNKINENLENIKINIENNKNENAKEEIIDVITSIKNAISTANAALSFEIGGTAITGGGITVTQSGSAAGDVDTAEPTAANRVEEDGSIEMITDGGSSTACECVVTFVIRR